MRRTSWLLIDGGWVVVSEVLWMGRSGEGFNLARVNQASLIDEPARRAERSMSVHGPCHRYGLYVRAMGGRDGRNRRAGIVRVPGYLPNPVPAMVTWTSSSACDVPTRLTYRLRFPCRGQVPKYHRHAFTNKSIHGRERTTSYEVMQLIAACRVAR